jgi:LacI family transcriptional regulator
VWSPRNISVFLEAELGYDRQVMHGLRDYAGRHKPWRIRILRPAVYPDLRGLAGAIEGEDGIIGRFQNWEAVRLIESCGICAVNVATGLEEATIPRVGVDNDAVGELAAKHLLERGFRHFASYHHGYGWNSRRRGNGFWAGIASVMVVPERRRHVGGAGPSLEQWLRELPKPVGLYVDTDPLGVETLETCRVAGIAVPEHLALVSTDNDELMCDFALPRMSSVDLSGRQIGYEAAALLERLMGGEAAPVGPTLVPPSRVVARHSSDVVAVDDADVAAALRFIRATATQPTGVRDVLEAVPVARRSLERRFRQAVGRSVLDEIRAVHVGRAKDLLSGTDLPAATVARLSGFRTAVRLSVVFHQLTGESPTVYRRRFRPTPV